MMMQKQENRSETIAFLGLVQYLEIYCICFQSTCSSPKKLCTNRKGSYALFFGCLKSHFFFMVEYDHKPFEPFFGSHSLQPPYIYRDNFLSSRKTTNWCLLVMLWVAIIFMISFLVLMRLDLQAYIKAHECLESNQWNTPVLCDRFYKIHMFKIEFQCNQTRCNHPMFNVILVVYCTEKIIGKHSDQMDARSPRTQLSLKFDRCFEVCSHNEGITGGFFLVSLVVWGFYEKIFSRYGDITITGDGHIYLTLIAIKH